MWAPADHRGSSEPSADRSVSSTMSSATIVVAATSSSSSVSALVGSTAASSPSSVAGVARLNFHDCYGA